MGLIERIKSALGLGTGPSQPTGGTDAPSPSDDVEVTVEHEPEPEPDTASEDAVKGTDTATGTDAATTDAAETEAEPDDDTDAADTDAADTDAADDEAASIDADLEDIKGIGPTYADRLREAGITGIGALADADPEALAAETDIAASRVENWVERARQR